MKPADAPVEWFMAGTESDHHPEIIAVANDRIVYPPDGTMIALDPDIPDHLQKVGFVAKVRNKEKTRWLLNDLPLEDQGQTILWTPKPGKYLLAIANSENKIVDSVQFEVR